MYNPRFPHNLSILRPTVSQSKDFSSMDFAVTDFYSQGDVVFPPSGEVTYVTEPINRVEMFDGKPMFDDNGKYMTTQAQVLEFGYRTNNQSANTNGDVEVNSIKLSTPLFTNILNFGDILCLMDVNRTYRVRVVNKKVYNWGANIYVTEINN